MLAAPSPWTRRGEEPRRARYAKRSWTRRGIRWRASAEVLVSTKAPALSSGYCGAERKTSPNPLLGRREGIRWLAAAEFRSARKPRRRGDCRGQGRRPIHAPGRGV